MAIAMQKPQDLDTSYELALLHEELGESLQFPTVAGQKKGSSVPLPSASRGRNSDDRRQVEYTKQGNTEERWSSLKNYRKAKGLCFICGERWAKDH